MKKKVWITWFCIMGLLVCGGYLQAAKALTIEWTGSGDTVDGLIGPDGDFRTKENWSLIRVPDDDDNVVFDMSSTYRVFFTRDHETINCSVTSGEVRFYENSTYSLTNDLNLVANLILSNGLDLSVGDTIHFQKGDMTINGGSEVEASNLLVASSGNATLAINGGQLTITNDTTIGSSSGYNGTVDLTNGGGATFGGTLNLGGDFQSGQDGYLNIYDGSSVAANNIEVGTSGRPGCSGNILISGTGSALNTANGRIISIGAPSTSFGAMTIENMGSFVSGALNSITVNATGTIANHGNFILNGDLVVDGVLRTSRPVTVGIYDQQSFGKLEIQIRGNTDGHYGVIDASKHLYLAGALKAELIGGFIPTSGDMFDILDWAMVQSGKFSTISLPDLSAFNLGWDAADLYTTGDISVVPLQFPIVEDKLLAYDGSEGDQFGSAVSISGDLIVAGAPLDDDNGDDSGAAYIYRWNGYNWSEESKLVASDGDPFEHFGNAVSISDNVAIVGAHWDDAKGDMSGAAYIFRWNGSNWIQEKKLVASNGTADDEFGYSVSIDGTFAVVGALDSFDTGYAHVYRLDGNTWVHQQKLTASDGATDDRFGISVCINEDVILVGASLDDDDAMDSGSVYVFQWNGSSWVQTSKLVAPDPNVDRYFGVSVSFKDDVALIGATGDATNGMFAGAAHVFRRNNVTWVHEQKLIASDNTELDAFGLSVSIGENIALVGAHGNDQSGDGAGAAYLFRWSGSGWEQVQKLLAMDGESGDVFGDSVSISDDFVTIGAFGDDDNGETSGSAYVYTLDRDWDGLPTWWETQHGLDPDNQSDAFIDSDLPMGDGLTNLQEYQNGTDPFDSDTDDDTVSDGDELEAGADPLDPLSHPDVGCICDFDLDLDVDASDLSIYVEGGTSVHIAVMASELGNTYCP